MSPAKENIVTCSWPVVCEDCREPKPIMTFEGECDGVKIVMHTHVCADCAARRIGTQPELLELCRRTLAYIRDYLPTCLEGEDFSGEDERLIGSLAAALKRAEVER